MSTTYLGQLPGEQQQEECAIIFRMLFTHLAPRFGYAAGSLSLVFCAASLWFALPASAADVPPPDLPAIVQTLSPAVLSLSITDSAGRQISTGTGFLVSEDGALVTNHHVIEGAAKIVAKADNGALFIVEGLLADDKQADISVLKLQGSRFQKLKIGKSSEVKVGERVVVFGSPLGLEQTVSDGIVSARRKMDGAQEWLQITAPISPGSSGSPVVNGRGEVIGVATMLLKGGQSLNFAIPVDGFAPLLAKALSTTVPLPFATAEQVVASDPILENADFKAAIAAFLRGEPATALARIQKAQALFPRSAAGHDLLGTIYSTLSFNEESIAASKQAVKLAPTKPDYWWNLAENYRKAGRTADARLWYRQFVKLGGDGLQVGLAWELIGDGHSEAGDYDAAIKAYQMAVKAHPANEACWGLIADISIYRIPNRELASRALAHLQRTQPARADEIILGYIEFFRDTDPKQEQWLSSLRTRSLK